MIKEEEEFGVLFTEMLDDIKTSKEEEFCVVCMENKKQLAPQECGHLCLCFHCTEVLMNKKDAVFSCPICKVVIKKKMNRIFM